MKEKSSSLLEIPSNRPTPKPEFTRSCFASRRGWHPQRFSSITSTIGSLLGFSKKTLKHCLLYEKNTLAAVVLAPFSSSGVIWGYWGFFSWCFWTNPPVVLNIMLYRVIEKAYWKRSSCSCSFSWLLSPNLSVCLIQLKDWLNWPHLIGTTNNSLRSEQRFCSEVMHCQTPMVIDTLILPTHYWLRLQMVDVCWVWGMDRTAVGFRSGTVKFTLSFSFEHNLFKVSSTTSHLARLFFHRLLVSHACEARVHIAQR